MKGKDVKKEYYNGAIKYKFKLRESKTWDLKSCPRPGAEKKTFISLIQSADKRRYWNGIVI